MSPKTKKTLLIVLGFVFLALLGTSLGVSIMCFIMSLRSSDKLLDIVSYVGLLLVIFMLVGLMVVYITYRTSNFKNVKEREKDEK